MAMTKIRTSFGPVAPCKVGIDYSTTSPAICIRVTVGLPSSDWREEWDIHYLTKTLKLLKEINVDQFRFIGSYLPGDFDHRIERYSYISKWAIDTLELYTVEKVYLEDYAYAATGRLFHIGENTGLLKYKLASRHILCETIAPTAVKKDAVGKGNASKQDMIDQFIKETNIDLYKELDCRTNNPISDIVDSYFICKHGK
jgi:Holliday junction resolvasome RuvABC endonuclease subunit